MMPCKCLVAMVTSRTIPSSSMFVIHVCIAFWRVSLQHSDFVNNRDDALSYQKTNPVCTYNSFVDEI